MLKFSQYKLPELDFKKAIKKPLIIHCSQIDEPFEVQTLEGILLGKKDDWLMVGVRGELYPCDQEIFKETYDLME